ncbi:MAG: hypothetical protein OEM97_07965 [Acidimicrobiia bacterium]|nr:hypothetical protein [Acidimicrobiia bacterium]
MDMIEFLQALRRQRTFLLLGLLLLVVAIAAMMFRISESGIESRISPKFEATLQMAVVPAGLETLADTALATDYSGTAAVYAQLLQSPEAAREIQDAQGVELVDELVVEIPSRTGVMTVTATATSEEGAAKAALGSFFWLEGRLAQAPLIAAIPPPTTTTIPSPVANPRNSFLGEIRLNVDPSYANASQQLFLRVSTDADAGFPVSLQDSAFGEQSYPVFLSRANTVTINLELTDGTVLAEVRAEVPELRESAELVPPLQITLQRGAFPLEPTEPVEVIADRISAQWDLRDLLNDVRESTSEQISVVLLTAQPIVEETGTRRAPVLMAGALVAGSLVLLALATTVDAWRRGRRPVDGWDPALILDGIEYAPTEQSPRVLAPEPDPAENPDQISALPGNADG